MQLEQHQDGKPNELPRRLPPKVSREELEEKVKTLKERIKSGFYNRRDVMDSIVNKLAEDI